jgi:t-SNARE complex subunit (syntaxin)
MIKRILLILLILMGLSQGLFGQKPVSATKNKLVAKLISQTSEIIPSELFETVLQKTNDAKMSELAKDLAEKLNSTIDSETVLSEQKKTDLKAKIPEFSQHLAQVAKELIAKKFFIKSWISESFQNHYSKGFTTVELQKLNAYFETQNGKETVKLFNQLIGGISTGKTAEPDSKTADQMGEFLKTPIGEKFFKLILEKVLDDIVKKIDAWGKQVLQDINESMTSGEIKRLMTEFIEQNAK